MPKVGKKRKQRIWNDGDSPIFLNKPPQFSETMDSTKAAHYCLTVMQLISALPLENKSGKKGRIDLTQGPQEGKGENEPSEEIGNILKRKDGPNREDGQNRTKQNRKKIPTKSPMKKDPDTQETNNKQENNPGEDKKPKMRTRWDDGDKAMEGIFWGNEKRKKGYHHDPDDTHPDLHVFGRSTVATIHNGRWN